MDTNILRLHHSHVGTLSQTKWELQPVCLPHSKRAVQSCRQGARTQALISGSVAVQTPVSPVSQIMSPNPRPTPYHVSAQGNKPVVKADFVTEPGTSTSGSAPVQRVPHAQLREESLSASPLKLEALRLLQPIPHHCDTRLSQQCLFLPCKGLNQHQLQFSINQRDVEQDRAPCSTLMQL